MILWSSSTWNARQNSYLSTLQLRNLRRQKEQTVCQPFNYSLFTDHPLERQICWHVVIEQQAYIWSVNGIIWPLVMFAGISSYHPSYYYYYYYFCVVVFVSFVLIIVLFSLSLWWTKGVYGFTKARRRVSAKHILYTGWFRKKRKKFNASSFRCRITSCAPKYSSKITVYQSIECKICVNVLNVLWQTAGSGYMSSVT